MTKRVCYPLLPEQHTKQQRGQTIGTRRGLAPPNRQDRLRIDLEQGEFLHTVKSAVGRLESHLLQTIIGNG